MEIKSENKMGTAPVWRLLLTMAIPVILSTAAQSLYNIVDGIFVSQLGEDAMAAITFAGPCTSILIAVGTGIAVGMNTMLSHGLGEKNQAHVNDAAAAAVFLMLAGGAVSLLAAFTLVRPYLSVQTKVPAILEGGAAYLTVYLGCGICTIAQLVLERMLIATGKTLYSMISQAAGAVLNLILDPILIFGYFGAPKLGITGAALATVIGQFAAACIALALNLTKNKEVRLRKEMRPRFIPRPPLYAVRQVLRLGLPTTILFALNSFMMINYNAVLNQFSSTAVAVFGACCRVTGFFYAVVGALCNSTIPILAYNHGAKNKRRIDLTIRYGYLYALCLMAVGTVLCVGFPEMFLRMFNATEDMIAIGVWGMRMLTCCYLLCGVRNMSTAIIQSLGHSVPSMAVDLSRNYAVLIPFAWLLSLTGNIDAVWISVPIADTVSAAVGVLLMLHFYRKDIRELAEARPV